MRPARTGSLEGDLAAHFFDLFLESFGFVLGDAFLDGLGSSFHQSLGVAKTQAGGVAHSLEHLDLGCGVEAFEDDVEFGLFLGGFTTTTAGVKGRYAVSDNVKFDGSARWSKSDADMDNGFPVSDNDDTSESEQWSGFARASVEGFGLDHQFSVSTSDIERQTFSAFPSTFKAARQAYRWQANGEAGAATYAFGAEREESEGSISTGDKVSLGTSSVFGTARYEVSDALSITSGLRFDDTDDFGSKTTGRISAAYELTGGFILSGAYGTGFKAPSVSQAVCDFCFSSTPYPTLKPETADSIEVALGWASADGRFDGRATLYRLNVEDQIIYFFNFI